ncbi:FHA domain-containing protein [Paenibacillus mendelii]|uniref:FHA domain-containing protein n=1 Tax=Paenibacillus mendelii TaxID=206163 RepID=A0ABV6J392_9BACL|nr:FHA domain-containing protein [Paenibacillus mendelii]MCQ6562846.1 winged helix-turn-helix domain-containing protein [Paenibacillus mendelii]
MSLTSCLVVLRGFPFDEGTTLPIQRNNIIIGRKDKQWVPDIGFDNIFISRKQASIFNENGYYYMMDLESKHGSEINGVRLIPCVPTLLRTSDHISFAKGAILLTFSTEMWEETMDYIPSSQQPDLLVEYKMDPVRQTVLLHDQIYHFSNKEYKCLELLASKVHQFVGKDEIIRYVWPERTVLDNVPSVSSEEVNSLLYRLRKKTDNGINIESIRGKGYILTFARHVEKSV